MKTLITSLAISTLFLTTLNASPIDADLNLHLFNYQPIIVQFDQTSYSNPTKSFSLNCIAPGRHRISVWSAARNIHHGYYGAPVLLYNGFIDLNPASIISTVITHNNFLRIENIQPKFVLQATYDPYYSNQNYGCNNNQQFIPHPISNSQFNQIKHSIANKNFDSTRLQLARQAVRNNPMNSRQIAELMSVLDFDSSRMEFAKFAYKFTLDPQNYFLLYDEFAFESSVIELSNFIDHHS